MAGIGKAIGVAMPALIGAGAGGLAGASLGGNTAGANSQEGIAIGAGIGLAAGGAVSALAGGIAYAPAKTVGAAMSVAKGIGKASIGGAEAIGGAAWKTGAATYKAAGKMSGPANVLGGTAIGKYGSTMAGLGKKLVTEDLRESNILKHKATKLGAGLIIGASVIGGMSGAFDELNTKRMGQMDTMIHKATPQTPAYQQNAGATGDLVFAMNANRRG